MKSTFIIATALANAFAHSVVDHFHTWSPPGPVRSPCPGLNTLTNHGFLPHDGKNIDLNTMINAFDKALNGDADFATTLFEGALATNIGTPNATTFSLTDLDNHDIIEHDASLSRGDFYFGDDHTFNQTIFDQTRSYWVDENIDIQIAANARAARIATSSAMNPTFNQSFIVDKGLGEPAAFLLVLGDQVSTSNGYTYKAKRSFVEYLFEHERFPLELGWRRPATPLTFSIFINIVHQIANASAGSPSDVAITKRRATSFHGF